MTLPVRGQVLLPAVVTAPRCHRRPVRRIPPALAALAAVMLGAVPAMAEPPASPTAAGSSTAPATPYDAPSPSIAPPTPYDALPSPVPAVDPAPSTGAEAPPAPALPMAPPPHTASTGLAGAPPFTLLRPAPPPWSSSSEAPPGEALPVPRRSPEGIAGGVILTALGGGGIVTGLVLFLTAVGSGVSGGNKWQGYLGGGLVSLTLGSVSLGIGIPLLRSSARKIVRDPLSAQLWLAPDKLTLTF